MEFEKLRVDLEQVTQQRPYFEGESMVHVLARLDAFAAQADVPSMLLHYLTRRSYIKALDWLDHPEAPHQI
ncbi:MAG: hypothetical protein ACI81V_001387 [Lentimonas sp.]|jgi:hypothetical protein